MLSTSFWVVEMTGIWFLAIVQVWINYLIYGLIL
ncbi:hypothetical protein HNP81_003122 [Peribacillus huizhouensis]|uniref:Uncharacterized protein n=1 Tax=Peribacillus huizhouensis TaxID=1501239 RepID=A0ABR6CS93_9BACI|nr:hypothetical protein [Peribacillus huizhouensis]